MSKFKVGDRVRIYGFGSCGLDYTGKIGEFLKPTGSGWVKVSFPKDGLERFFHEKQLRKLKPKKPPREFWCVFYSGSYSVFPSENQARVHAKNLVGGAEVILLREVRKK